MASIYLAGPLFTAAEIAFNADLARKLRDAGHQVAVPQDFCLPCLGPPVDFAALYRACLDHLAAATLVVAVLDGADPDSGTCFEVGWAVARGIPVIGLRTDIRPGEDGGLPNCMLTRSCLAIVRTPAEAVAAALGRLAPPPTNTAGLEAAAPEGVRRRAPVRAGFEPRVACGPGRPGSSELHQTPRSRSVNVSEPSCAGDPGTAVPGGGRGG